MRHTTTTIVLLSASVLCGGEPELPQPLRVGPPTFSMPDLQRYEQYARQPPEKKHPIPQHEITRETYYLWLTDSGHLRYVEKPQHGKYGPRHLLPVLARYVRTGEEEYGRACMSMLKDYHRSLDKRIEQQSWHHDYMDEPTLIGLYRRYLAARPP